MDAATMAPEVAALKDKLKATWMAGNYDHFSRFMERSAVELLDRVAVPAGASLLDVACGSGAMLPALAARVGTRGRVIGIEQSDEMLALARGRFADR